MAERSWRETLTDPVFWAIVHALVLLRMLIGLLT
jgi:hypothetical protein